MLHPQFSPPGKWRLSQMSFQRKWYNSVYVCFRFQSDHFYKQAMFLLSLNEKEISVFNLLGFFFFFSARSLKYLVLSCLELVSSLQSDILRKLHHLFFKNPLIQYNLRKKLRLTHPAQGEAKNYDCFFTMDFWISDLAFILVTPVSFFCPLK